MKMSGNIKELLASSTSLTKQQKFSMGGTMSARAMKLLLVMIWIFCAFSCYSVKSDVPNATVIQFLRDEEMREIKGGARRSFHRCEQAASTSCPPREPCDTGVERSCRSSQNIQPRICLLATSWTACEHDSESIKVCRFVFRRSSGCSDYAVRPSPCGRERIATCFGVPPLCYCGPQTSPYDCPHSDCS
jgi:hypothetical protein